MTAPDDPRHRLHRVGTILVAAQFALIGLLALAAGRLFLAGAAPWFAWLLLIAGGFTGAAALAFNRPGNFNIRPVPRPGAVLVERGPYRWVRHPMYSSLLLVALACLAARPGPLTTLAVAGLAIVLGAKAMLEEQGLLAIDPGYASYRTRTRRFIPWLY